MSRRDGTTALPLLLTLLLALLLGLGGSPRVAPPGGLIPLPSSLPLLASGLAALLLLRRGRGGGGP